MNDSGPALQLPLLAPELLGKRAGFRLHRLEVLNWGTFHHRVWPLNLRGDNALLTGDIGSGKSTLVDAITTLLVPSQKITYNKAAGAEMRERTLRTYVLGHYKSERSEASLSAKPVALRDRNSHSVILARFLNEELEQDVTLAQVLWFRDVNGQPARLYIVADSALSIAEHFTGFGTEIDPLRKRLRAMAGTEVHDSFPPYGAAYRRRFGIDNDQAMDLFYQTVSMKSVGNLTEFVREHMLAAFPVEQRVAALIEHFDDLNRAHESVLKAKDQIERLAPLVADCDSLAELAASTATLRACRDALRPWFAGLKADLLRKRSVNLDADLRRLAARIDQLDGTWRAQQAERDQIRQAIADNGGDRIERLKVDIKEREASKAERARRAEKYDALAHEAGLPTATDVAAFTANQRAIETERDAAESRDADTQNALTDANVAFRQLKQQHDEIAAEVDSLRRRRSSIPARMLDIRDGLCRALGLREDDLPFAGELIQVREQERDWEGAIERLLHNFGISLLVPDTHYARVAEWVDRTHLGGRLVYYRVRERRAERIATGPRSLVRKLSVQPDSPFYNWLDSELPQRFDYACCASLEEFRREDRAITRTGQVKARGERHEKDDRHAIGDRSRYVLGWSNDGKIAALERQAGEMQKRMQQAAARIAALNTQRKSLQARQITLQQLAIFESFQELDWKPLVIEIERLDQERRQLEVASDVLHTLQRQLADVDTALNKSEDDLKKTRKEHDVTEDRRTQALAQLADCEALLAATPEAARADCFARLDAMRDDALGTHTLTVESCDNREHEMRVWLQARIDAEDRKAERLTEKIIKAMESYCQAYPLDAQEMDASVAAADEYRAILQRLRADDLPRFEQRFKELLNENTIREVANFQSQLNRERQTIRERIDSINRSLREIDYGPGRYIRLEVEASTDIEIRDFQNDLRACTEGTLTGSDDAAYSEAKFLQVRRIIERLRGRDGTIELDRRWTEKVTDVRTWFTFSASERWREDDREHEHYADSGGKSGGQKEKLAYTVLAASLAYQFGLERGTARPRSFRFVVIDEAFGRGSDESAQYGLELFRRMNLQLLIVTPLQKIHIIEPYVANVGFVHNEDGRQSMLRNLTIDEYRAERDARAS
ncbi:ATP-binding protein [Vineibacter terrae]|uniref:ATP-binding protein n=1 Tax=Vineibacter terrae TaxID=2586908 RepID=UPI002E371FDC|nr:SbcC/MukB-like Walker B domain-containing protein [Vineibacter terrae]HEX2890005.1 SbcC/MukB-like Walker B domain-containing protein [Vineibacter terrae]